MERLPFLRHKWNSDSNEEDQEPPENQLKISFAWQKGTGERDFIEADQANFGKDVSDLREYDPMARNLSERPEGER